MNVVTGEKVLSARIQKLNKDIEVFPQVHAITESMSKSLSGVQRLVMLDRYAFKDTEKKTLAVGDLIILTVKKDPKFPGLGFGIVMNLDKEYDRAMIEVEAEFRSKLIDGDGDRETGIVTRSISEIEKPLEIFYEQIALRNATGLSAVEPNPSKIEKWFKEFYDVLVNQDFVPAGRVLYGAGAETDVTYFNCYVMPFPKDSRGGISRHREETMEIMSRGGGVGTNGSTLRPRNALARGVNGRSSGSISWLDDLAQLTHKVEQGGSRRGAQMMMMADWHPDILEFITSKMQNPKVLRFIIENTKDEQIKRLAEEKLKFTPLTANEETIFKGFVSSAEQFGATETKEYKFAKGKLDDGGSWSVANPEFLSGANISVCVTHDLMKAIDDDADFPLRFPDVESYSKEEMAYYDKHWSDCGDVREWESEHKMRVKIYRTIKAKELWNLINMCATYSAEPGIFFIDNANDKTNAKAYGQSAVATNPCGEQPLAPYSVCNLAAVNLANMANKETKQLDIERLKHTVRVGVRMQDNVIDATPYFLAQNEKQALGERRVGLGVMGLADILIYCEKIYGSDEGNELVDEIFEIMATTAYETSIELSKERGSFPFLENREAFINTGYMKEMPEHIRQDVLEYGIRNSHLLTVAPTGSTGTMVGCGTGLEPYFSFSYFRNGRLGEDIEVNAAIVQEYLDANPTVNKDELPEWFVGTMGLSPEAHVTTQCVIQRWIDSSLSKTVNAPRGYTVEQVQHVYELLHKGGAKGGTVYVDGSRDAQVLTLTSKKNDLDDVEVGQAKILKEIKQATTVVEDKKVGTDVGDRCPTCRNGTIMEAGGCHTCDGCGAQISCGL